ncbi:MAG TPA: alpha/beta hydrolase [Candidatus Kapabacteria bacterium]|nr:alpha/beta hydrolase [Candidatus Kapabacteria bacterium]
MIFQNDTTTICFDVLHDEYLGIKTPLLFLHSALGTRHEFDKLKEYYSDRTLILPDFPSHGESTTTLAKLTMRDLANYVRDLLIYLEISSVDIIGYSMGGYAAIELALQSRSLVRSITSHAMKFYWTEEAIADALSVLDPAQIWSRSEKAYAALSVMHEANGLERTCALASGVIEYFRKSQLNEEDVARLECPLLLSTGDSDAMVTPEEVTRLYQSLPKEKNYLAIEPHSPHQILKLDLGMFTESVRIFQRTI